MEQINWKNFGLKGESEQKSFEDICMFLFCRELKISKIDSYYNQPGIETEPLEISGKKYGFQAKFFESKFDWQQIKKSIFKALGLYPELNEIFIYSNKERTKNRGNITKPENEILKEANKKEVMIKYITYKDLMLQLSKPQNLDLAQLYFGIGDELGFIKNSVNPIISTLLKSSEYIELPFIDKASNNIDILEILKKEDNNILLLTGHPGSGKSIYFHKLLDVLGGLDKENKQDLIEVLVTNNAVPVLINLKNCINETLEEIIRRRQTDSKINGKNLGFIYLFDGLDELDESKADFTLFQMHQLKQKDSTKKIIISCRSGNLNKIKARSYFKNIIEYKISNLEEKDIDKYFKSKGDSTKEVRLHKFKSFNQKIVLEVKDVLLIKLFWDTIEELDESSTILDLFSKKIDLLLEDNSHKKNIENLNLLNDKKEEVINLNQDISFEFQKKIQYRFYRKDLQELLLIRYPQLDYSSINAIVSYLEDLFFDNHYYSSNNHDKSYIYQHRRYQEFFLTKKLKSEFEEDPQILRKLNLISNRDYIENLFLPNMRKEYKKVNNLAGMLELNLIDVYLGNNKGFNINDYCFDSPNLFTALVSLEENTFSELFESKILQMKDNIYIDLESLEFQLGLWNNDKDNIHLRDKLISTYSNVVQFLIEKIVLFWKFEKQEVAQELKNQLSSIISLYDKFNFLKVLNQKKNVVDPFYEKFEDWIYILLIIDDKNIEDIFDELHSNSSKIKLLKPFFQVCLKEKIDRFIPLLYKFNTVEYLALLEALYTIEHLPIFLKSEPLQKKIKNFLKNTKLEIKERTIFILFYKKYLKMDILDTETEVLKIESRKLMNSRGIDWNYNNTHIQFAYISFILDDYQFESILSENVASSTIYYNALKLYSALFREYVLIIKGESTIESTVRDYIRYVQSANDRLSSMNYLKVEISELWGNIFNSDVDYRKIIMLKQILQNDSHVILAFEFYLQLLKINPTLFTRVINKSDLFSLERDFYILDEDFQSLVNKYFQLSLLYSKIDIQKALTYFERGITEGLLRPAYRKDVIVSYYLVDALRILWENNWESLENLNEYSRIVFNLTIKVSNNTDGKNTWQGPYNVIELVADYNLELAELFKNELIEIEGYSNFSNQAITSILKSKARRGFNINEIEKEMSNYRIDYDYKGIPRADYYEQKFIVFLEIANSNLFSETEKKTAFENAYNLLAEVKEFKIEYFLKDQIFENEKSTFENLCKLFNTEFKFEEDRSSVTVHDSSDKKISISEENFRRQVYECNSKKRLIELYQDLYKSKKIIELTTYKSWEVLLNKTYKIEGNLNLLFDLFSNNHFPHIDYLSSNSKYMYKPLAIALKNMDTKQETFDYLFEYSGHGGFINVMKAYELIDGKRESLALFNRYVKFCQLLVN